MLMIPFRFVFVAMACLALPAVPAISQTDSLSGLCLDNAEAGCQGRFLPFNGLSIDFCEESCTLINPVPVRDLDGTLYDLECVADYPTDVGGRVLLLRQTDWDDRPRLTLIDRRESRAVVPCP